MYQKRKAHLLLISSLFILVFSLYCTSHLCHEAEATTPETKALEYYQEGLEAMKNRYFEDAIRLFEKAISIIPKDRKIRIGMMFHDYSPNSKLQECKGLLAGHEKKPAFEKPPIKIDRDTEGPEIVLLEPSTKKSLTIPHRQLNITIRGMVKDKSGVSWLKINQVDTPTDENGYFLKSIPLNVGINDIDIEASDILNHRARLSLSIEREKAHIKVTDLYRKSVAVVIGIDDYEHGQVLDSSVNSAVGICEKLKNRGFDRIITLFDREATKSRILNELYHKLPGFVSTEDRVVVFFAGFGYTEELINESKTGYIVPADASPSHMSNTAIPIQLIKSLSDRIQAKHILYVMESCISELSQDLSSNVSSRISDDMGEAGSQKVVQIIIACGNGHRIEKHDNQGLFTSFFLRGLDGEADMNKDSLITGTELGEYLKREVSAASQRKQIPFSRRLFGEGEIFLNR